MRKAGWSAITSELSFIKRSCTLLSSTENQSERHQL